MYPELVVKKKLLLDAKASQDWRKSQRESQAKLDDHSDFYNRLRMKQRTLMF